MADLSIHGIKFQEAYMSLLEFLYLIVEVIEQIIAYLEMIFELFT